MRPLELPRIRSLDLRPEPNSGEWMTWDWPEFPSRVKTFIETGNWSLRRISVTITADASKMLAAVNKAHALAYATYAAKLRTTT